VIIKATDGEGEVIEREAGGARQGQALSRMMVLDHSVRLRRRLRVPKRATLSRDHLAQMLDYLMNGVSSG
jgi:hypothetical protein